MPKAEATPRLAELPALTEREALERALSERERELTRALAESQAAHVRTSFLVEASAALSSSLDFEETLERVTRLAVPSIADWCSVELVDEESGALQELALAHRDPRRARLSAELWQPHRDDPDGPAGPQRVIRTGQPELYPELRDDSSAPSEGTQERRRFAGEHGLRSAMVVPMLARGRCFGAITFLSAESGRRYGPADLELAELLGRRAGVAIDNARLYAAERDARERAARLQSVSAAFSGALTTEQVAEVALSLGRQMLGAESGELRSLAADGAALELVELAGTSGGVARRGARVSLDSPGAVAEALRSRGPLYLEDREEYERRFPESRAAPLHVEGRRVVLPLLIGDRPIGTLGLGFADWRPFRDGERVLLLAVASQCAQALDRARLYDQERRARFAAERATQRLRLLSEASALLASSLEWEATVPAACRLALGVLADTLIIDVLDDAGVPRRLTVEHADPARAELGAAEICSVPLVARDRTLGALSFTRGPGASPFDGEDRALAEDLGRRAALAIDNARLYRDAKEAVAIRDDFLSVAGHELKTPLTSVILQVQSLVRAARTDPALARVQERAERATRNLDRLTTLINDLLDVSRITTGRLRLELDEVELGALVRDIVGRHAEEAVRARCEIHAEVDGPVAGRWDRIRVEQVVLNLLTNAFKYGRGAPVRIGVSREGDMARLVVRDSGIGIAPEHQARIFERFERAVSSHQFGGLGLGLWIVRQIVEAHDGTIRVESATGTGATFEVRLPIAGPGTPAPPPGSA